MKEIGRLIIDVCPLRTHYFTIPWRASEVSVRPILNPRNKTKTYILIPLDPCLELSQAEVKLNTKHDCPIHLSVPTPLGHSARCQSRQISPHEAQCRAGV